MCIIGDKLYFPCVGRYYSSRRITNSATIWHTVKLWNIHWCKAVILPKNTKTVYKKKKSCETPSKFCFQSMRLIKTDF